MYKRVFKIHRVIYKQEDRQRKERKTKTIACKNITLKIIWRLDFVACYEITKIKVNKQQVKKQFSAKKKESPNKNKSKSMKGERKGKVGMSPDFGIPIKTC